MRTLVAGLALLLVAACAKPANVPPSASRWHDCDMSAVDGSGHAVASFELSRGDHATVHLYGPGGGPCADGLVIRHGAGVLGTGVSGLDLDPSSVRVARLRDGGLPVVVASSRPRQRGGFQPHLFVLRDGLAEVVHDGRPVLPFVVTDVRSQPVTATCEPYDRIAVWTATAHQPPGIVLAWDVRKTVYTVDGGHTRQESSSVVESAVADPLLRKKMPQLFTPESFLADCRGAALR